MGQILVSGSSAYDYNLRYDGEFREQFGQWDITQWLNMSLLVPELDKTLWWTGLSICYNLALLSENPILITATWGDMIFDGIIQEKVNLDYVHRENMLLSPSAYIISDTEGNQMSFFHPWAMEVGEKSKIQYVREHIDYAIVSPDKKQAMIEHVHDLFDKSAKVFLDPGQQITEFSAEEILPLFDLTAYLIVNQYEYRELMQKIGLDEDELKLKFNKIIVTYGAEWSQLIDTQETLHIPAILVEDAVDTTGAWDAYRAGLLKWLSLKYDWKTSAQIGTILASYCVQHHGAQNHFFNLWVVMEDMKTHFWKNVDLYGGKINS